MDSLTLAACPACFGTGTRAGRSCNACRGLGLIRQHGADHEEATA